MPTSIPSSRSTSPPQPPHHPTRLHLHPIAKALGARMLDRSRGPALAVVGPRRPCRPEQGDAAIRGRGTRTTTRKGRRGASWTCGTLPVPPSIPLTAAPAFLSQSRPLPVPPSPVSPSSAVELAPALTLDAANARTRHTPPIHKFQFSLCRHPRKRGRSLTGAWTELMAGLSASDLESKVTEAIVDLDFDLAVKLYTHASMAGPATEELYDDRAKAHIMLYIPCGSSSTNKR